MGETPSVAKPSTNVGHLGTHSLPSTARLHGTFCWVLIGVMGRFHRPGDVPGTALTTVSVIIVAFHLGLVVTCALWLVGSKPPLPSDCVPVALDRHCDPSS